LQVQQVLKEQQDLKEQQGLKENLAQQALKVL
jgi:hypothetical protein